MEEYTSVRYVYLRINSDMSTEPSVTCTKGTVNCMLQVTGEKEYENRP